MNAWCLLFVRYNEVIIAFSFGELIARTTTEAEFTPVLPMLHN